MRSNPKLTDTFLEVAKPILARHGRLSHVLVSNEKRPKVELTIHQQTGSGFDAGIICEAHGLYPWAGGWHGSSWDMATPHSSDHWQAACENCLGFLRTLLSEDARLRVREKDGRALLWTLEFRSGSEWEPVEESGTLLFNLFGTTTERILQNHHLLGRSPGKFQRDQLWHSAWVD